MDESKYLVSCNTEICSIKVEIILFYAVHSFLYSATASFVFANNHVYTIKLHFVATLFLQFQCNINKFIWQGRHEKHHFGRYVPHATRNSVYQIKTRLNKIEVLSSQFDDIYVLFCSYLFR